MTLDGLLVGKFLYQPQLVILSFLLVPCSLPLFVFLLDSESLKKQVLVFLGPQVDLVWV